MSIMDAQLLLRAAAAGNLNANELTPTSKDFGGPDQHELTYVVVVPQAAGTSPTLDITIQESDNDSTWHTVLTLRQISTAGKYYVTGKLDGRYRRYTATVGGTTPNFGAVIIAPVIGGQYDNF